MSGPADSIVRADRAPDTATSRAVVLRRCQARSVIVLAEISPGADAPVSATFLVAATAREAVEIVLDSLAEAIAPDALVATTDPGVPAVATIVRDGPAAMTDLADLVIDRRVPAKAGAESKGAPATGPVVPAIVLHDPGKAVAASNGVPVIAPSLAAAGIVPATDRATVLGAPAIGRSSAVGTTTTSATS